MFDLRRGAACTLALVLFAATALPALAEDASDTSSVPAASAADTAQDTASSWPELRDWLAAHKLSGGTVRLTADIEIGENYDYTTGVSPRDFREPVTVECGAHTISVLPGAEVYLIMTMYKLTVSGDGGARGLLRVLPGGTLYLDMLNLTAASAADSAVVQEEGALLVVDQKDYPPVLTGQIRYAAAPVLLAPAGVDPSFCVVPESAAEMEDIAAALPETAMLRINWQGEMQRSVAQPVVWDTAAIADDLAARRRTVVRGSYTGALNGDGLSGLLAQDCPQFSAPQRTLAFPVDGAALMAVSFLSKNDALIGVSLDFVAEGPMKAQALVSQDEGASWTPLGEQKDQPLREDGAYSTAMIWPDEPLAGTPWFLVELVYPDGTIRHTDVIAYAAGMELPIDYIDGHRGGGEPITPPEPPASSSDPTGDSSASGGDPGSGGATDSAPPASSDAPGDSGSPDSSSSSGGASDSTPPSSSDTGSGGSSDSASLPAPDSSGTLTPILPPASNAQTATTDSSSVAQTPAAVQPSPPASSKTAAPSGTEKKPPASSVSSASSPPTAAEKPSASSSASSAVEALAPVFSAPQTPGEKAEKAASHGLSPGVQIALGCAAVALVGGAAVVALNPHLLRRLRRRGRKK